AGFPCQPFSSAGLRKGFNEERGNLFFDIVRVLEDKKPFGFLLENVDAIVKHNNGKTFSVILDKLKEVGYKVSYAVLNSKDFGIPQNRKRVYICGTLTNQIDMEFKQTQNASSIKDVFETGTKNDESKFIDILLSKYSVSYLKGKAIKDKRGGSSNIHSWDLELKGKTSKEQKKLMNLLLKKRRMKKWALSKGIKWMDGMPLTFDEISSFYRNDNLKVMLDDLVEKGYLKYEHPKELVEVDSIKKRVYDTNKDKGYNIVAGKLSFPIAKILDPDDVCPTLVATETGRYVVPNGDGLRRFTVREGLRLAGFPDSFKLNFLSYKEAFHLLGNTITPPVVENIIKRVFERK
ncbi:MAG: DNA (cytosine-5-)-methyltransferase, partial [Caldisericia bacterium]|nr:DNA (cytosine-5-)-methyltransferase [Caldisericia bacterium]